MFRVVQLVTGKWRLSQNGNDLYDFDSVEKCKEAMQILIHPKAYEFDDQGREVKRRER